MRMLRWATLGHIIWAGTALILLMTALLLVTIDDRYSRISNLASRQMQAESRFKEVILRSRHGLDSDYDRLNEIAAGLRASGAELLALATDSALAPEVGRYDRLLALETEALENFKFRNAVVRNSLHYLQFGTVPLLRTLPHNGPGGEMQHDLTEYVDRLLFLALVSESGWETATAAQGQTLLDHSGFLPENVQQEVRLMVSHGNIVVRHLPELRQSTANILDSGSGRLLANINALAQERQRSEERRALWYYLGLATVSAMTLVILFIMGRRHLQSLGSAAKQKHFLQTLMDHAGVGVLVVTSDDRIAFANPEAAVILGYELGELSGLRVHEQLHIHPDSQCRTGEDCPVIRTLAEQGKWQGETAYRAKDGRIVPVMLHAVSLEGSDQEGSLLVVQDITELKEAREVLVAHQDQLEREVAERTADLEAAEARHRAVVEIAPDGFLVLDRDKHIVEVNAALLERSGYGEGALLGQSLAKLDTSLTPERVARINTELSNQGHSRFDTQLLAKSGETWPVEVTMARWPAGNLEFAFVRDTTEQKAAEAAREAARQEAERLARVKSEFLANMSHEIRTPLNGVLGMAQIGLRTSEGEKSKNSFARIIHSGKLLLGVINDILDFSKIEAGRMSIERVPIPLPSLLRDALQLQELAATAKGIGLRLETAPNLPPTCLGDPLRLSQVLSNLLANAIKFTQTGSVLLGAELEGDRLLFSISDTGIGMSAEQVGRLFTPFEQADGSTTRRFGGTGLGLVITQRLVDLMGGTITVHSKPDEGSVFQVRLPLVEALPTLLPLALPASQEPGQRLLGLHVLVAEDDEINRLVLEDMLGSEGARVTLTGNGREVLERVIRDGPQGFDCVLMDVQMPEMDGLEATRRLGSLAPGLPVIGQTAHALPEEKQDCLSAGMVDHVAKPVDLDDLVDKVRNCVQRATPEARLNHG